MSFRWRLLLGLLVTVLLTAAIYAVSGFLVFQNAQQRSVARDLATYRQAVLTSLDLSGPQPGFAPSEEALAAFETYSNSGFTLWQNGELVLEVGRPLPELLGNEWQVERLELKDGLELQLALNISEDAQALRLYNRTALLALLVALALAALLGWVLQQVLLQPLRALQHGVEQLSAQAFPEPVAVPPGNDELSELARSFNRMTASLQAFLERERSFTRYASHELRTPLSNLKVLSEGLRRGILEPGESWAQIEDNLSRMEAILSGLLNLSRSPQLRPEPIPLEPVLRRALAAVPEHERGRLQLDVRGSPYILGDEELLGRVLSNLIDNALKYSDDSVQLALRSDDGRVRLRLRDYGPGVPENALERLTQPFFRGAARKPGLGLGLALTQHIVNAMEGSMHFENARPGLAVTLEFPELRLPDTNEPPLDSSVETVDA